MIPVYWATQYSTTLTHKIVKTVACEKCGCQFAYEMVRRSVGSGTAAYSIGQQDAQARAGNRAVAAMESMLQHHEDPVACPACGWFQASMIFKNQRRFWYWTPWGGGMGIDGNRDFPNNRGHFPGTPTAVRLAAEPPADVPTQRPPILETGDVLTIRLEHDPLPPVCCHCLGDAEVMAVARKQMGAAPGVSVLLCKKCQMELQRAKERTIAKILILPAASLFLCFLLPAVLLMTEKQPILQGLLSAAVCSGVASVILGLILSGLIWIAKGERHFPAARVISVDYVSMTCRVHFPNAAYREVLCHHIGNTPVSKPLQELLGLPTDQPVSG